jgi:hypothetical protein
MVKDKKCYKKIGKTLAIFFKKGYHYKAKYSGACKKAQQ